MSGLSRVTGMDVSHRSLRVAQERLNLERMPKTLQDKLTLLHGSLVYRDARFSGYDVATVVEVIEHLDESRLGMFTRGVAAKRSLALKEFALGVESLSRFVRKDPLRRVHECAFGVLALESEPIDPRL